VTSGFRRDVDNCTLLGYYAAANGNPLSTFRDNVSVPSSRVKKSKKKGPIRCPETAVKDYHSTVRNAPEERNSHYKMMPILFENRNIVKIQTPS
jgi:hypothetical protein